MLDRVKMNCRVCVHGNEGADNSTNFWPTFDKMPLRVGIPTFKLGANPSSPGGSSWLKSHNNGSTYGKGVRCTVFVDNSICIRLVNEKGCKLKCIILSVTSCVSPLFYIIYICKAALLRVYLCELGTPFCYKVIVRCAPGMLGGRKLEAWKFEPLMLTGMQQNMCQALIKAVHSVS